METGALPVELLPWVARANGIAALSWQDPRVQRRLLGLLFAVLSAGLGLIAVFSALEGGSAWVIALAAAVLAVWMGDLSRRALTRPRA